MWRKWGACGAFGALRSDSPVSRESTLARRKDQALHRVGPDSLMLFMGLGTIEAWSCVVRGGSLTRHDNPRALWNCSAGSGRGRGTTIHPFICPSIYSSIHCLFNTYCFLDALLGAGAKPVNESTQGVELMREAVTVCRTGAGVAQVSAGSGDTCHRL